MRKLLYAMTLLIKNVENKFLTALHRQKVRQAYRGFYIDPFFILPVLILAAFIGSGFFISKYLPNLLQKKQSVYDLEEFINAPSDSERSDERFLEPFPVIPGMEDMRYILVADKHHRVMYLLRQGRTRWGVVKIYPIAVGEVYGQKLREGDRRTPQGIYFVVNHRPASNLIATYGRAVAAQFGPHAFVLNYPNRHDIAAGRGGSGIWVHGTFEGTAPIVSRGCVSTRNVYIEDLFNIIGEGLLVPVIIVEDRDADFKNLINLEEIWYERNLVAEEFGIDPRSAARVGRTDIRALPEPEIEGRPIENRPTITLPPQPEITPVVPVATPPTPTPTPAPAVPATPTTPAAQPQPQQQPSQAVVPREQQRTAPSQPASLEAEILQFAQDWAVAWSSRDMERYVRFYDQENFPNWAAFRAQKAATFRNNDTISVVLENVNVVSADQNSAVVRFRQLYRTERVNLSSMKQLDLVRRNGSWKIVNEFVIR